MNCLKDCTPPCWGCLLAYNPFRSAVRAIGFCDKEILEVARQPRLLVLLVLCPLLILILFGFGYRSEHRPLRTLLVAEKNDPIAEEIFRNSPNLGNELVFQGVEADLQEAKRKLQKKQIDLIVIVPGNAGELISRNRQAVFTMVHDAIDPVQAETIRLTGAIYVDRLNHRLLESAAESGRAQVIDEINSTIDTVHELRKALERADLPAAQELQNLLKIRISEIGRSLRSRLEAADLPQTEKVGEILIRMSAIRMKLDSPLVPETEKRNYAEDAERAVLLENDLIVLSSQVENLRELDADLLLSPFASRVEGIGKMEPNPVEFASPAILILFLQHLAVTFAALSLVREFQGGRKELFRISPLRSGELLLGKYFSYLIAISLVVAVLFAIFFKAFRMPFAGNWPDYISVLCLLLLSSLGFGFVISTLSRSEEQAIQYCMLFTLASILFTGFTYNTNMFWKPLHLVSYAFPATYGIQLMQDVMLRGNSAEPVALKILAVFSLALYAIASRLSRRRLLQLDSA